VRDVLGRDEVTERRACRVLGQARNTHRRKASVADDEPRLVKRIVWMASEYGRYGYRRITALLRAEGWWVNHKRVERIWRQEGLRCLRNSRSDEGSGLEMGRAFGCGRRTATTSGVTTSSWIGRRTVGRSEC
jgi:transposase InsO family protein